MKSANILKLILLAEVLLLTSNSPISGMNTDEYTLIDKLVWYAMQGEIEHVSYLIAAGAEVNGKAKKYFAGWTPLIAAASNGQLETVDLLLASGACTHQVSHEGETALVAAFPDALIVEKLINAGADVNQIMHVNTPSKCTPLMIAARRTTKPKIVDLLINAGANIYYANSKGETALTHAVSCSVEMPIIQALLKAIIKLDLLEKNLINYWLLVSKKMVIDHNIWLPKDLRKLIAEYLIRSLAQDLRQKMIRAGGDKIAKTAIRYAKDSWMDENDLKEILSLAHNHLNLDFLEAIVRQQMLMPKRVTPESQRKTVENCILK